jgi:hypothetical protein
MHVHNLEPQSRSALSARLTSFLACRGDHAEISTVNFLESCLIDHETTFEPFEADVLWTEGCLSNPGQHAVEACDFFLKKSGLSREDLQPLAYPLVLYYGVWRDWRCHVSAPCSTTAWDN